MRKLEFTSQDLDVLLQESSYAGFLQQLFLIRSREKKLTYAQVSRKAGFSSRAFIREVVLGKKRLTSNSLQALVSALEITGDLKDYFIHLVAQTEPDVQRIFRTKADGLSKLRKKLLAKNYSSYSSDQSFADKIYQLPAVSQVFAALGDINTGASLNEIIERIQMPRPLIMETLKGLIETGLVQERNERYFVHTEHVSFAELGRSEVFKKLYTENIHRTRKVAESRFDCAEDLFFLSSFSVDKTKLKELKIQLRELMNKFVQENENANGDTVTNLVLGYYR